LSAGENRSQELPGASLEDEAQVPQKRSEVSSTRDGSAQWKAAASAGDYAGALREIDRLGESPLLRTSTAEDLILLGNAARFGGRPELAEKAYEAVRASSPGGSSAALCAYYLARIALDTRGDRALAIRFLRTYLREAKNGELAPSARARLMDLLTKQGDTAGAQAVAREYLTLHPRGPHADVARKLAGVAAPR
jgi:tetratricopeptide (TPR) repeat protein